MLFLAFVLGTCWERSIVPWPNSVTETGKFWELEETATIGYDKSCTICQEAANFVAEQLRKSTGFKLDVTGTAITSGIYFASVDSMETEEYSLTMSADVAKISAKTYQGLMWGYQSLIQLLPPEIVLETKQTKTWRAQALNVNDKPRYPFRGIMAETSRHFLNITELRMLVDHMARYKLNILHLHFSDDQGWRLESKKFPKLTEIGSYREASPMRWDWSKSDNTPYGPYFYTIEEMRDLIRYAKQRGIEVFPEVEIPGHSLAALAAYPEYSCTGGPFKPWTTWGVQNNLYCAGSDKTLEFLEELLDEIFEIFNETKYIHIGGDECPKDKWKACSKCQQRMKEQGLQSEDKMQVWLADHFAKYSRSKGRTPIEWDDVVGQGIPEDIVVMAWLGHGGEAAKQGRYVVQAPFGKLYFPQYQFTAFDGYEYPGSLHSLKSAYTYNPEEGVDEGSRQFVLGVEAPMWTEHIWNLSELAWKAFPRGMALAEIGWTNADRLNWPRFISSLARCKVDDARIQGINTAPLTINPAGRWLKGEVPSDHYVTMHWDVKGNFESKCNLEVAFVWEEGTSGLKMKNVKLIVDGKETASDDHEGTTGEVLGTEGLYHFWTESVAGAKNVAVQADVMADGSSDTQGSVYCYSV